MAEVGRPELEWRRYMLRRVPELSRTTPQRVRIVLALLDDARRSNRAIAGQVRSADSYVHDVRHWMEGMELIPVHRSPPGDPRPEHPEIRAQLLADPSRGNREIAALVPETHRTVWRVRHELEAAYEIHVWRSGRHDPRCWCALPGQGREFVVLADGRLARVVTSGGRLVPWDEA